MLGSGEVSRQFSKKGRKKISQIFKEEFLQFIKRIVEHVVTMNLLCLLCLLWSYISLKVEVNNFVTNF